jgi:predicted nucleic acid-binding protein
MDDKKTRLRDTSLRGVDARQVLENPAYQAAMKTMKEQIVREWAECPVRDVEGQKLLLQLHKLAVKFENMLTGMVETGKLAQMNLDAERDENIAQKVFRRVT